jgi:hypothetical protein
MKKIILTMVLVAVVAVTLASVGMANAQGPAQTSGTGTGLTGGRGSRGGSSGGNAMVDESILHDYLIAAYAQKLNIPAADLETRLNNGETMAQIAVAQGFTIEQTRTLMVEARTQAIDQALKDGKLTQEQADWMKQISTRQMAGGQTGGGRGMRGSGQGQFANSSCLNYNQTNP